MLANIQQFNHKILAENSGNTALDSDGSKVDQNVSQSLPSAQKLLCLLIGTFSSRLSSVPSMDFTRPFPRTSLFRGRLWLRGFWGHPWELCPLGHSTRGKGPSCSKLWRLWTGSVACLRLSGDIPGRPLVYSASGGTVWRKWSPELVKGVSIRSCHERRSR